MSTSETASTSRDMIMTPTAVLSVTIKAKQLVDSIGASPMEQNEGQTTVKGQESDHIVTKSSLPAISLLCVGGLLAGCLSFFTIVSVAVDLASVILVIMSLTVTVQKYQLRSLGGLRGQHNQLRAAINTFHGENLRLGRTISLLEQHQARLEHVEADLAVAVKKSGAQVDKLLEIVNEDEKVNAQLRSKLQAQVVQQIMTAVLNTDRDANFSLSPAEVETLMLRLQHLPGVSFAPAKFREAIASDQGDLTLSDVCAIARTLNQDLADKDQAIFCFQTRQIKSIN